MIANSAHRRYARDFTHWCASEAGIQRWAPIHPSNEADLSRSIVYTFPLPPLEPQGLKDPLHPSLYCPDDGGCEDILPWYYFPEFDRAGIVHGLVIVPLQTQNLPPICKISSQHIFLPS